MEFQAGLEHLRMCLRKSEKKQEEYKLLEEKKKNPEANKALFLSNTQHKVVFLEQQQLNSRTVTGWGEDTAQTGHEQQFSYSSNLKFCKFITIVFLFKCSYGFSISLLGILF